MEHNVTELAFMECEQKIQLHCLESSRPFKILLPHLLRYIERKMQPKDRCSGPNFEDSGEKLNINSQQRRLVFFF